MVGGDWPKAGTEVELRLSMGSIRVAREVDKIQPDTSMWRGRPTQPAQVGTQFLSEKVEKSQVT